MIAWRPHRPMSRRSRSRWHRAPAPASARVPAPMWSGRRPLVVCAALVLLGPVAAALPATAAYAQDGSAPDGYAQDGYAQDGYTPDDTEVVETEYGPLTAGDRDLVVRVRYAGLWEIPAGEMAAERGTTEQIREIGTFIAEEHEELDQEAFAVAAELDIALPTEPYAEHQNWLDRIDAQSGEDFDQEFIQLLREAHGAIYPLIAYVRASTQNDLIREFANTSEEFVARHMDYLESSGLVDWVHIPPPPEPAGTHSRFLASNPGGVNPVLIWILLAIAAAGGGFAVLRTVRPR